MPPKVAAPVRSTTPPPGAKPGPSTIEGPPIGGALIAAAQVAEQAKAITPQGLLETGAPVDNPEEARKKALETLALKSQKRIEEIENKAAKVVDDPKKEPLPEGAGQARSELENVSQGKLRTAAEIPTSDKQALNEPGFVEEAIGRSPQEFATNRPASAQTEAAVAAPTPETSPPAPTGEQPQADSDQEAAAEEPEEARTETGEPPQSAQPEAGAGEAETQVEWQDPLNEDERQLAENTIRASAKESDRKSNLEGMAELTADALALKGKGAAGAELKAQELQSLLDDGKIPEDKREQVEKIIQKLKNSYPENTSPTLDILQRSGLLSAEETALIREKGTAIDDVLSEKLYQSLKSKDTAQVENMIHELTGGEVSFNLRSIMSALGPEFATAEKLNQYSEMLSRLEPKSLKEILERALSTGSIALMLISLFIGLAQQAVDNRSSAPSGGMSH